MATIILPTSYTVENTLFAVRLTRRSQSSFPIVGMPRRCKLITEAQHQKQVEIIEASMQAARKEAEGFYQSDYWKRQIQAIENQRIAHERGENYDPFLDDYDTDCLPGE